MYMCQEPYPDVTFTIHMRRGSLFYVVNLIAPCLLIFFISFLGFFLPVESGEKVNLETTILHNNAGVCWSVLGVCCQWLVPAFNLETTILHNDARVCWGVLGCADSG